MQQFTLNKQQSGDYYLFVDKGDGKITVVPLNESLGEYQWLKEQYELENPNQTFEEYLEIEKQNL